MKPKELLNINEVADYMGIHKITLYRLVKDQKIPAFKVGRQWRFQKELLDKWMAEKSNQSELKKNEAKGTSSDSGILKS